MNLFYISYSEYSLNAYLICAFPMSWIAFPSHESCCPYPMWLIVTRPYRWERWQDSSNGMTWRCGQKPNPCLAFWFLSFVAPWYLRVPNGLRKRWSENVYKQISEWNLWFFAAWWCQCAFFCFCLGAALPLLHWHLHLALGEEKSNHPCSSLLGICSAKIGRIFA